MRLPMSSTTRSGMTGVTSKDGKKWEAKITENGKTKYIGFYNSELEGEEGVLKQKGCYGGGGMSGRNRLRCTHARSFAPTHRYAPP